MRTPPGVFSNDSISPKFSLTRIPAPRNAEATAAETSSSSVGRIRGPRWKSCTREPKALKTEATCAPVAPPPITSIDAGTEVRPQASLCVLVSSNPGTSSRRLTPPVHRMHFSAWSRSPVVVSIVCGSTNRAAPACSYSATPSGHARRGRPRGHARAAWGNPAPIRSPRRRIVRVAVPPGSAAPREPMSAPERGRHWPPCRRTRRESPARYGPPARRRATPRPLRPVPRQ